MKLTVDGQEFSQPLTVLRSERRAAATRIFKSRSTMLWELRRDAAMSGRHGEPNESLIAVSPTDMIRPLKTRRRLKFSRRRSRQKLIDIEDNLIQRRFTGQGQDTFAFHRS